MKVLFVSSGNNKFGISPIVLNQGESLKKEGIDVDHFNIIGKGVLGYIKNVFKLKRYLRGKRYDLIHAHYSYSGFVASLSMSGLPVVVSLMGTDIYKSALERFFIVIFARIFWKFVIVKSKKMKKMIKIRNVRVIPNGVDLEKFKIIDKDYARSKIGFRKDKKYILFASDPMRKEKNFKLALESFKLLSGNNVELEILDKVDNSLMPFYLNASDLLLVTSKWEGSPNIVKEALACNLPIVSTDVGDVKERLKGVMNSYICSSCQEDISNKIKLVLSASCRSNGREIIVKQGLDSVSIAGRIVDLYNDIVIK